MRLQANNPNNRRKKKSGGFTTIEQIVVIILVLILASGLIIGIMKWVEWTNFKRQNEYAQTLFAAAQNQLTEYSESGTLSELQGAVLDSQEIEETGDNLFANGQILRGKDGEPYKISKVWPQSEGKGKNYRGTIYSVIGTPDDFKAYQAGNDVDDDIRAMYDLLTPYVYDTSIFSDGYICLEFAPEDGQVFAVLYSDKAGGFEYNSGNANRTGVVDISNRKTSERKKRMVGYYGVDMLSKATSTASGKPSIGGVRLNNEDTLNLSFKITKLDKAIKQLTYEVSIYDQSKDLKKARKVLELTLPGKDLTGKGTSGNLVSCEAVRYNYDEKGKSAKQKMGKYLVHAWIEDKSTIRVVLDSADLSATSKLYKEAYEELMKTDKPLEGSLSQNLKELTATNSFRRFGVDTEDIYCTVRGSGNFYKPTAKKKSNTENTYFGSVKSAEEDKTTSTTYTIKNARHLYNIRYLEDYGDELSAKSESRRTAYQLTEDVDWGRFAEGGSLYESGKIIDWKPGEDVPAFPSVKQLRADSVMEGTKNKSHSISGLRITKNDNETLEVYADTDKDKDGFPTGLFLTNKGTIQNFKLDKITVSGQEKTGAFCGINKGKLSGLETADSDSVNNKSTVTGTDNTGGIFGYEAREKEVEISGLINRAKVSGVKYVGGIVGMISGSEGHKVTITGCKNYGVIAAASKEAENIGGITGYIASKGEKNAVIDNCTSSPQYSQDEIKNVLSDADTYFIGKYVGGIAGYSDKGTIQNCSTQKESRDKEGFVIGSEYVGGIVGYSSTDASVGTNEDDQKLKINAAHVLGNEYAGGIVGKNAGGQIEGWTNKGIAAAKNQYAGGIAGWNGKDERNNTGRLTNCSSNVENSDTARLLTENIQLFGSYAGGIAGYNNSIIENRTKSTISIVSYVLGKNYIGGIVGYNDSDGDIDGYAVAGGYVKASGCYAGGYAGVNVSGKLISGKFLRSNPNEVSGAYCVGGTIGGNIVALNTKVEAKFHTDNFLGTLKADAFAGGFIGYNKVISTGNKQGTIKEKIEASVSGLMNKSNNTDVGGAVSALAVLDELETNQSGKLIISGMGSGSEPQSRFGGLTAKIYVGGVIGYHSDEGYNFVNRGLVIQNVVNKTPVTAAEAVENDGEQMSSRTTYKGEPFRYSYAGGIMGRVSAGVQLTNCKNQDVGDVTTKGTYLGGICEINEGSILFCTASSIGRSGQDYVGGIAGLNKSGGEITDCTLNGKTVTGRNYVGGLVSENFGTIGGATIQFANIRSYGTYEEGASGGVAAYNYGSGRITINFNPVSVNINADGYNVGGITGCNEGSLVNGFSGSTVSGTSNITGNRNVGGIVGDNRSAQKIEGFYNSASVTARNGNAGGIAGRTNADIEKCTNTGSVQAQRSGNAGGIVGSNTGIITSSKNRGSVSAQNGICGGITGVNEKNARIDNCEVTGKNDIDILAFEGKDKAGGICGINYGTIRASAVINVSIRNLADSKDSMLGGITGENNGKVTDCHVGTASSHVNVKSNAGGVAAGGIAGKNNGEITAGDKRGTVYADLSFASTNQAYYGNMGGIAGANLGVVENYEYSGTVAGTGNNPQNTPQYDPNTDFETNGSLIYGYGGIAGVNGDSSKVTSGASIRNCKVNTAKITGLGDANNIANAGGVAGVNSVGASISEIEFGTDSESRKYSVKNDSDYQTVKNAKASVYVGDGAAKGQDSYTHAGGVAGLNSGSISNIGYDENNEHGYDSRINKTSLIVEGYRGHTGGIVGYNRRTGMIHHVSTGDEWIVFAPNSAQDNGCGGIAGYSASEKDMTYCFNRAFVQKTVSGSNGIGGIVGRLECATSSSFTISSCRNYGSVMGANRAGGIVGVWKYYGGTIADCINYAQVKGGDQGNGGIAGQLYQVTFSAARFTRCENHGTIEGTKKSAGIVGGANGSVILQIDRCANTGLIKGAGNEGGGIIATLSTGDGSYMKDTNNYGYQYSDNAKSIMNGIKSVNNGAGIAISGCFGVADTVKPLTEKSGNDNYYISYGNTGNPDYPGTKLTVKGNAGNGYRLETESGKTVGLPGFSLNPQDMAGQPGRTSDEKLEALGDGENNIRYQMFEADNPYFISSASAGVTPGDLEAPVIEVSKAQNGTYQAEWKPVEKATFYNYTIQYMDGADGQGTELYQRSDTIYSTKLTFPVTAINGVKVKSVILTVTAGADTTDQNGKAIQIISDKPGKAITNIEDVLPIPQYHLELVHGSNNQLVYKAYLDNRDEYEEFLREKGLDEEEIQSGLEKIVIHIGIGSSDIYSFKASDGNSGTAYYSGTDNNVTFYAYAASSDGSISSPKVLRESMAFVSNTYVNPNGSPAADIALVYLQPKGNNQIGFQGTTANTLTYRLTINHKNSRILYMRSELMATDISEDGLGVPVAVSASQLRTSDTSSEAAPTYLSSLPANLMDSSAYSDLMVRSYPVMMSNNVVYSGHFVNLSSVKEEGSALTGVSKDRLKELYVTGEHQVTDENTTGTLTKLIQENDGKNKLASGFVIELADDGSYTLYYNALLEYNSEVLKYEYNEGLNNSKQQTQVFYYRLKKYLDTKTYQPKPVILVNEENGKDGNPDKDTMVITWDLEKDGYENDNNEYNYTPGAVYDYVITGYTADDTAVQIEAGVYTTGIDGKNELELDTGNWNYKKVAVSISRRGKEDTRGMTEVFPTGTVKELELKLRFTQITKPDIFLHKEGDVVQKNSLIYDVTWANIPEEEQKHMSAYEILAVSSDKNTGKDYSDQSQFNTDLENAKKLYEKKDSNPAADSSGNKITYTWTKASGEMNITKTMVLSWTEDADASKWNIKKNLTAVFRVPWSEENINSEGKEETVKRTLDLNDFGRGEELEISVRGLAGPDTKNYRDGAAGIVREMTLPSRLDVPDVTEMEAAPAYHQHGDTDLGADTKPYMTLDELKEKGITLTITPSEEAGIIQGTYQLAAAVYDTKPANADTDTSKVTNSGDGDGTQEGYWNTGAKATVISKASETTMDGSLQDAEYVLKFNDSAYAGKWLKIAVRSISESNISSLWSDEDDIEENEGTVNYKWIQIPRVQLEVPELTQDSKDMFYSEEGGWMGNPSQESAGNAQYTATQTRLSFELSDNADSYQIQMVRSPKESDEIDSSKEKYRIYDADWIYAEKARAEVYGENRYHIFYASSNPEFDEEPYRQGERPASLIDGTSVYLGTVTAEAGAGSFVSLPYHKLAAVSADDNANKITASSYIQITGSADGKQEMTIVLPDVEKAGSYSQADYLCTSQVSVQARVTGENPDNYEYSRRYEDSFICDWYRGKNGTSDTITMSDYQKAPANIGVQGIETSTQPKTAYNIKAQAGEWLVFQVEVYDAAGTYRKEYVSAYGAGTSGSTIHSIALLPMKDYEQFAGKSIRIRVAAVIPGENTPSSVKGGLSQWTDWIDLGALPAAAKEATENPAAARQEDETVTEPGKDNTGNQSVPSGEGTNEEPTSQEQGGTNESGQDGETQGNENSNGTAIEGSQPETKQSPAEPE